MKTTLNQIKSLEPCTDGWKKLLRSLGKTEADDEPLSIIAVLDSSGLDDALLCLSSVVGYDKEIRLYAVWCARQMQHLMTDQRGITTQKQISSARSAAFDAAGLATWAVVGATVGSAIGTAAMIAFWVVAGIALGSAVGAVVGASIGTAIGTAGWAAAGIAARDAALATARSAQEKQLRKVCAEIEILEAQTA